MTLRGVGILEAGTLEDYLEWAEGDEQVVCQEGRLGEPGDNGAQGKGNEGSQEVAAPGLEVEEGKEEEEKGKWVQDLGLREAES